MTERMVLLCIAFLPAASCKTSRPFPWPDSGEPITVEHAQVRTVNDGYERLGSRVLVRQIDTPTRANLDFAAYHANVMVNDPEPEMLPPAGAGPIDADEIFGGLIDATRIHATLGELPLTEVERNHPMAFTPLVEWLAKISPELSTGLEDLRAAVRSESWGGGGGPHIVRQHIAEVYVHEGRELWLCIELEPWVRDFTDLPDEDGDGFAEFYVTPKNDLVPARVFELIRDDYAEKTLGAQEILTWANELTSYWYPSYMTDLADVGPRWPDDHTEADVRAALGAQSWEAPTVVMVGKPQGDPIYNVFLVRGVTTTDGKSAGGGHTTPGGAVTPDPAPRVAAIEKELADHGSWESWQASLAPFHTRVRRELEKRDASLKGIVGRDGFLFFRNSMNQMVGGDFQEQPVGKNPFPVIVEFKEILAKRGVDFLFVPVPTKAAIYPDKLESGGPDLVGKIVTPYERKLLLELGQAGVEIVDLLPAYLDARQRPGDELYLAQDTHWTDAGLRLAAELIAERIKKYPWYEGLEKVELASEKMHFTEEGDLPSRLAPAERKRYKPVKMVGRPVFLDNGELYDDVAESPITILGDSFTGVYQRTFCRNGGVSAHIAEELQTPVDLVMSYGGGPNVRKRLLRRGADALGEERLVVWIMAARDLYDYWEDWELLGID